MLMILDQVPFLAKMALDDAVIEYGDRAVKIQVSFVDFTAEGVDVGVAVMMRPVIGGSNITFTQWEDGQSTQ
jgi:hypothetical protein